MAKRRRIASGMFTAYYIQPKFIRVAEISGRILATTQKYKKLMLKDFESCVATWNHDVNFVSDARFAKGRIFLEVWTTDEIFAYIDRGTLVRRALMTDDFQAKTRPGFIGSGAGRGGVAAIHPSIQEPGIQARNFSIIIREKHEENIKKDIKKAIREGLRAKKASP